MLPETNSRPPTQLAAESLESRFLLSTVSLNVAGQTGEEAFRVLVNESVVLDTTASIQATDFSIEVADSVRPEDIRIEFTNDLYQPEIGVDRNLTVNFFALNESAFDFNNPAVFSTGTWTPQDGITAGFGRGNVLHGNGAFSFSSDSRFEFNGFNWTASQTFSSEQLSVQSGELVLNGSAGTISAYREIGFAAGRPSVLSVDAYRDVVSGGFASDSQPWATAGVNFYDNNGNLIQEFQIELNGGATQLGTVTSRDIDVPFNTATAFAWVWVNDSAPGTEIPLRVSSISLDQREVSEDTEPPTIRLGSITDVPVVSGDNDAVQIVARVTDNLRPFPFPGRLTVVRDDGSSQELRGIAGGIDQETGEAWELFQFRPSQGGFTSADNGEYTIRLEANTLVDRFGNAAPEQVLGSFVIDISAQPLFA